MKVAIVIPYFGRFPVWFDLYLYSCSLNSCIDVLFFTDCSIPDTIYPNTIFIKTDFESYCKRVSSALDINFSPCSAYKLCDLRPFYGIIHAKELESYDFWGFGDIDLVYGNLTQIVNAENLKSYDFITTHGGRAAGHFTIINKKSKYSNICFDIPNWKFILEQQKNYILDEVAFAVLVYPQIKWVSRLYYYIIRKLQICNEGSYYNCVNKVFCNKRTRRLFREYFTTPRPTLNDEWEYDLQSGQLAKMNKGNKVAIPYLHFLLFKKNSYFELEHYWNGDYYNISKECFEDKAIVKKLISISLDGIRFKK